MAITTATWTPPIQWLATTAYNVARSNAFLGTGPSNLGGNQQYLYDYVQYAFNGRAFQTKIFTSSYSATTSTFTDIDSTNLTVTATINSGRCLVIYMSSPLANTGNPAYFDIYMDSATAGIGGLGYLAQNINNNSHNVFAFFTGLSVGAHTFRPRWRNTVAAQVTNLNSQPHQLIVIEL